MTMRIRRPAVAFSLLEKPGGSGGPGGLGGATSDTHSALTTRRGAPSICTTKSAGVRSVIGLASLSTTPTSSDVTSTDDRKTGGDGWGGCWAPDAAARATIPRQQWHARTKGRFQSSI